MSTILNYDHDKLKCKRCNELGKSILKRIRILVQEWKEIEEEENNEQIEREENDVETPLITYPLCRAEWDSSTKLDPAAMSPGVWELKRYPSKELICGEWSGPCVCKKSNGLQEDCRRKHCRGRACCFTTPPSCLPSGRWKNKLSKKELSNIMVGLDVERIKPCDIHTIWNPTCHLCRWHVNEIMKSYPYTAQNL